MSDMPPPLPGSAPPAAPSTRQVPPVASSARASKSARRSWGFPLHWIAWIFAVAALAPGAAALVMTIARGTTDLDRLGRLGGSIFASCVTIGVCYFIGWGAYAIFRRSRLAGNLVFCILCSLLVALFVRSLETTRILKQRQDAIPVRRIVVPRLQSEWASLIAEYERIAQPLADAGGWDASTLQSVEDIDTRLEHITAMLAMSDRMVHHIEGLEAHAIAEFEAEGLPAESAVREAEFFVARSQLEALLGVRETDHRILLAGAGVLRLLRETWGEWEYDAEAETTLLPTDEAVERFTSLQASIEQAAAEQMQWSEELKVDSAPN